MGKKRKRFVKSVMAMMLVFCMVVGVVLMKVRASTNEHTRDEAVAWAMQRVGKDEDMDGYYGAQCVDLIVAYYIYLGKPRPLTNISHYAKDFLEDGSGRRPTEWSRYKNGQTTPQPGDVVIFDAFKFGVSYTGHVGVVVSADEKSYYYIDFNGCGHNDGYGEGEYYDPKYPEKWDKYTCPENTCDKGGGYGKIREKPLNDFSGLIRPDWPYSPPPGPSQGSELSEGAPQTLSNGDYLIVSALMGDRFNPGDYCLSADAYGNNVQIEYRIGEPPSVYTVTWLGNGFYRIKDKYSDKYLEVQDGSLNSGANVQQFPQWPQDIDGTMNAAQQWRINETNDGRGGYTLQARCSSYYLDVNNGSLDVGTNIQVLERNDELRQRWFFIPWGGGNSARPEIADGEYQIVPKMAQNKALNAQGNGVVNGTNIILWPCKGDARHTFSVKWLGKGYYEIVNKNSNLSLDVRDGLSKNGTNVQLWQRSDVYSERWLIKSCGDGYYNIISKCNGLYLDLAGGYTTDEINIQVCTGWGIGGGDAQKWKFEPFVATVDVESVTLDRTNITLKVGDQYSLATTLYPANATYQTLTWTNSNPSVATLEYATTLGGNLVTAKSAGTATITATSKNGKTATCEVTVQEKDQPPCEHVYGDDWQFDGEKHWKACNQCGEKIEEATHGFVQKSDENNHWKECLCGARTEELEHMFAWVVDQAATQDSTGLKHEECGTCGSKRSEGTVIEKLSPDHEHVYGSVWQSDGNNHWKECECGARTEEAPHELTQNSDATKHWKECACGKKIEESIHGFTWIIDRDATQENEGVKHEQCNTCGYIRSEGTVIEKLPTSGGDGNDGDGGQSGSTGGNTGGSQSGSSGGNSGGDQSSSSGGNSGSQSGSSGGNSGDGQNNDLGYIFGTPEINTNNANAAAAPVVPAPIAQTPAVPEEQKPNQPAVKQETVKAPAQDDGKPFIKGADGKIGWEVIREEEEKAKQGSTINVDMGKTLVVPGNIFDSVKNKDVTLTFDMGNGILWSVGGKSVTADKAKDIDFNVKTGVNTIPAKLVNSVAGKNYSTQISIAHDGEFGFTAVLCINIGTKNKGLAAKLYYYNKDAEALEFVAKDTVTENGLVSFALSHASDYVIVVEAEEEDKKAESTEPESVETQDQTAETAAAMEESPETENPIKDSIKESPETAKSGSVAWLGIVGILVLAGAGMTVLQAWKKKKERD